MSRSTPLIFAGLSVLLLGALVLVGPPTDDEAGSTSEQARAVDAALSELQRKLAAREERISDLEQRLQAKTARGSTEPGGDVARTTEVDGVAEPTGVDFVERAVAERTALIRNRGRKTIDEAEVAAAYRLAREIQAARNSASDAARGGTMAWLDSPGGAFGTPEELTASAERMAKFTRRQTQGPALDGTTVRAATPLADGAELHFGTGVYVLDVAALNGRDPFPQDLLITGDGMDETLLRLGREFTMRADVHSLTFRDVTLDAANQYFERMRNNRFTLRMERCRVVGFDKGSGQSTMLGGRTAAFYAQDCRFEAGFGKSPGSGRLFSVGRMLAARIENCVIVGPLRSFNASSRGALHFVRCEFVNGDEKLRQMVESPKAKRGIRFEDCTVTRPLAPSKITKRDRRSLSELNPAWPK